MFSLGTWFVISKEWNEGFNIGLNPIWIHRHQDVDSYHFHFVLNIGFWYIEITIGKDAKER